LNSVADMNTALSQVSLQSDSREHQHCAPGGSRRRQNLGCSRSDQDTDVIGRSSGNDIEARPARAFYATMRAWNAAATKIRILTKKRNGTQVAREASSKHVLADGDIIKIGDARLVYKAVFSSDDLTVVDQRTSPRATR